MTMPSAHGTELLTSCDVAQMITIEGRAILAALGNFAESAASLAWQTFKATRINRSGNMFERGRTIGYHRGYYDGRRRARPVLVPAECEHCGHPLDASSRAVS